MVPRPDRHPHPRVRRRFPSDLVRGQLGGVRRLGERHTRRRRARTPPDQVQVTPSPRHVGATRRPQLVELRQRSGEGTLGHRLTPPSERPSRPLTLQGTIHPTQRTAVRVRFGPSGSSVLRLLLGKPVRYEPRRRWRGSWPSAFGKVCRLGCWRPMRFAVNRRARRGRDGATRVGVQLAFLEDLFDVCFDGPFGDVGPGGDGRVRETRRRRWTLDVCVAAGAS